MDVIYFYPTTFNKASEDAPDILGIGGIGMRTQAQVELKLQASVFEEDCNVCAPYYRQISAPYALTLSDEEADDLLHYSALQDPSRALDYYFEHYLKSAVWKDCVNTIRKSIILTSILNPSVFIMTIFPLHLWDWKAVRYLGLEESIKMTQMCSYFMMMRIKFSENRHWFNLKHDSCDICKSDLEE